jgi:hypothetical protein
MYFSATFSLFVLSSQFALAQAVSMHPTADVHTAFSRRKTCPAYSFHSDNTHRLTEDISQERVCSRNSIIASSFSHIQNFTDDPNYLPWDSAPLCVATKEGVQLEYCIYSNSAFSHGRGLSVITNPSIISSIALSVSKSALDNKLSPPNNSYLFYETSLPGRGKGLISNHTFHKGDLILTSTPLFIVHEATLSTLPAESRLALLTHAISQLPLSSRPLFYTLAGHFGGDVTEDILLTNGFNAKFGSPGNAESHGIVVPEAARLNHDCRPNARFAFDPVTLIHKVHATRTILPGEELTVSYIDTKQRFSARQRQITTNWGFTCTCGHCSATEKARNESDARLSRIPALRKVLLDFDINGEGLRKTTPGMAKELVTIYEKEALDGSLAEAYMLAAFRSCVREMEEDTKRWAKLATMHWLVWENGGQRNLEEVRKLSKDPRSGWCWSARKQALHGDNEDGNVLWP